MVNCDDKKYTMRRTLLFSLILLLSAFYNAEAQDSNYKFSGDIRIAHIGNDTNADGIGGPNSLLRFRPGITYTFNANHSFRGRLVYLVSKELEPLDFTITANGNRAMAFGSISFDEFYYKYSKNDIELRIGRFQSSFPVLSNARRSQLRFQSNAIFVHWIDGAYLKTNINDKWFGEAVLEYQNRDNVSYGYRGSLSFGNNQHNLATYLGLENRTRDNNNIIQKGFGIFIAPDAFQKTTEFTTYAAFTSRIVFDLPKEEALNGGSFRIAAELGQNLNAALDDGTSAVMSFGVNNVADKHEFMVEFTKTGSQWLTAPIYGPNSDEVEFRYRFFYSTNLNFDIRYRIRESRNSVIPTAYSTFIRATYSF